MAADSAPPTPAFPETCWEVQKIIILLRLMWLHWRCHCTGTDLCGRCTNIMGCFSKQVRLSYSFPKVLIKILDKISVRLGPWDWNIKEAEVLMKAEVSSSWIFSEVREERGFSSSLSWTGSHLQELWAMPWRSLSIFTDHKWSLGRHRLEGSHLEFKKSASC